MGNRRAKSLNGSMIEILRRADAMGRLISQGVGDMERSTIGFGQQVIPGRLENLLERKKIEKKKKKTTKKKNQREKQKKKDQDTHLNPAHHSGNKQKQKNTNAHPQASKKSPPHPKPVRGGGKTTNKHIPPNPNPPWVHLLCPG